MKYLNDNITKRIFGFSKFLNDFIYFNKYIIGYSFCKSISICKNYFIILFPLYASFMLDAQEQRSFVYSSTKKEIYRNKKSYELTNHLGNVLTTLSDRKEVDLSATPIVTAEVKTATDYYPGGMLMPSRNYSYDANYRYKHQGQESDDDLTGDGNNYFYKYRMSDARLNRFWSIDKGFKIYLNQSPYCIAGNNGIGLIENSGLSMIIAGRGTDDIKINKIEDIASHLKSGNLSEFQRATLLLLNQVQNIDNSVLNEFLKIDKPISVIESNESFFDSKNWVLGFNPYNSIKLISDKDALKLIPIQNKFENKFSVNSEDNKWTEEQWDEYESELFPILKMVEYTGAELTPDEIIVHEMGHAINWYKNELNYKNRGEAPHKLLTNREERYNIKTWETPYRALKGKDPRTGGHMSPKIDSMKRAKQNKSGPSQTIRNVGRQD